MDLVGKLLDRHLLSANRRELSAAYNNFLFKLPGPTSISQNNNRDHFVTVLVQGLVEVMSSKQAVLTARECFKHHPRPATGISRSQYFAFIVHAYLNAIYVLEERMHVVLKRLTRASAKSSDTRTQLDRVSPLISDLVRRAFENVRLVRGSHVHDYEMRDEGLSRLGAFELLTNAAKLTPLQSFYRSELIRVKKEWEARFATNETAIDGILDLYCDSLLTAILNADGTLRPH